METKVISMESKETISKKNINAITEKINTLLKEKPVNFLAYHKDETLQKEVPYAKMRLVAKTGGNYISRIASNHQLESLSHRGAFAHVGDEIIFSENKVTCIHDENNTNMSGIRKKTVLEIAL